jgi:hypothetical protein
MQNLERIAEIGQWAMGTGQLKKAVNRKLLDLGR